MKKQSLLCLIALVCATAVQAQEERTLSADSIMTADGRLDSLYMSLPEVLITGERPIVKSEQGKLVYDLPRLIRDLPVDNAYDAVKELPGVIEMNGGLTLAGQAVTIVLNGKVTTLSAAQLEALLKSTPASRLDKAEVMYSAPARYQVRGALINITLRQNDPANNGSVQGELFGKYAQKHYESFEERASLTFTKGRLSGDLLYDLKHGRGYFTTDKEARHTLADGSVTPVNTYEVQQSRNQTHNYRLGLDYDMAANHRLSLVYTGAYTTSRSRAQTRGNIVSANDNRGTDLLNNLRLDYTAPFGLKAGAEYTNYNSPYRQQLNSETDGETLAFRTNNRQHIDSWKLFAAQEHSLAHGWTLNYGAVYTTTVDNSYQYYRDAESSNPDVTIPDDMHSRRHEQTLNLYAGTSKTFGKLSLDASLAAEHYRTPAWNEWNWYPVFNLTYMPAAGHIWQLSLSSDKSYPGYWELQNAVSYMGGSYSEIQGNPLLKPAKEYDLTLGYILKGKYVFRTWFSHTQDYSTQTLYQSPDRLVEIYKYINFNYSQQAGLQASLPFRMGRWLDSRLTLVGVWQHERADKFWDLPFDRAILWGMANLTNTITMSTQPDLKLTLSGMIRSTAHQGIYDLPPSGNVNVALRYAFAGGNGIVNLYANDLFETNGISPRIRYKTQYVTNHYGTFREVGMSFTWKFGGYKEKQREQVDTSRFK